MRAEIYPEKRANGFVPIATVPILVALAAAAFGVLSPAPAIAEDVDRVVLRVNDEIATLYEYESRKAAEITNVLANPSLADAERQERLEKIGQEVMQSLFSELLLVSYADQQGIRVSDGDVDDALREMMRRQGVSTREELEEALAPYGMTVEQLTQNVRRDLIWQQVIGREVNSKVEVGEEELRAYYRNNPEQFRIPERRKLREVIVLDSSGLGDAELRRLAGEIRGRLEGGAELESVAEEYSEQELTTGVIDLGWLRREELEESLAEAAWALEPGGYSPPVAARGGYHVVQLVELQEATVRDYTEVEAQIRQRLRSRRFSEELRAFIAELEESSYVQEDLPPEAVGYRTLADDYEPDDELELFRAPVEELEEEGEGDGGEGAE